MSGPHRIQGPRTHHDPAPEPTASPRTAPPPAPTANAPAPGPSVVVEGPASPTQRRVDSLVTPPRVAPGPAEVVAQERAIAAFDQRLQRLPPWPAESCPTEPSAVEWGIAASRRSREDHDPGVFIGRTAASQAGSVVPVFGGRAATSAMNRTMEWRGAQDVEALVTRYRASLDCNTRQQNARSSGYQDTLRADFSRVTDGVPAGVDRTRLERDADYYEGVRAGLATVRELRGMP